MTATYFCPHSSAHAPFVIFSSAEMFTTARLLSSLHPYRGFHSSAITWLSQDEIKAQVTGSPVVLYMKGTPSAPMCGFSKRVVDVLMSEGAVFESHNVLADESLRQGIKEYSFASFLCRSLSSSELLSSNFLILFLQFTL